MHLDLAEEMAISVRDLEREGGVAEVCRVEVMELVDQRKRLNSRPISLDLGLVDRDWGR